MVERRAFLAGMAASLLGLGAAQAQAQQRGPAKIAFLALGPAGDAGKGLREGMRAAGYAEGADYAIEEILVKAAAELPAAAAKAAAGAPRIIVALGTEAALAAKAAGGATPIVAVAVPDPVGSGLVSGLGRPGGNITGPGLMAAGLTTKRLQYIHDLAPTADRIGIMFKSVEGATRLAINELTLSSQRFKLRVSPQEVRTAAQIEERIVAASESGVGALLFVSDPMFQDNLVRMAQATLRVKMPAIYESAEFARAGGLISYGPNLDAIYRRAAFYVDRILKGTKPDDLPIEEPRALDLAINRKTAMAFGIALPRGLLDQATEVIG